MFSSILVFILVLSVLVLVHELGHFLVAKRAGVMVEEFGIGIPPRVFGIKIGETTYSVNLLPFGGFVRLHGESGTKKLEIPKRAFVNKSKKIRAAIIIAGVIMNFILGVAAFSLVYSIGGIPQETGNVKVVDINSSSPAQEGGLLVGDIVRKVNDIDIESVEQFIESVEKYKGQRVTVFVERGGVIERSILTPRVNPPEGEGPLGVAISSIETYFPPLWKRPFIGIYYGFREAIFWGGTVVSGLVNLFSQLLRGQVPKDIAGPVGIFAITSQAAQVGAMAVINFVGILSVNLAILNILPFPALDGGRLAFLLLESVVGKRILPRVEAVVHTVGMIILLSLLVAITAHDIQRLIVNGGITGFIDSVLK